MQDKFEEFLEKNQLLPDVETPDDEKIWHGISADLGKTRRLKIGFLSAAAIILLLVSSGIVMNYLGKRAKSDKIGIQMGAFPKQFGAEEDFFRKTVIQKLDEVKRTSAGEDAYVEMMEQLDLIDSQYATYMSDLQDLGSQPKILRGIIRCYEMKIRVIEKTLNEIEKSKKYENEKPIL
jgi:hypothetical protein